MPKFCPNCGEEISEKVKFCPKCGADIDSFSVKKDEKSIVEEPKQEIKIEDAQKIEETKIENKKLGTTYNIKNLAVYGIFAIVVIIIFLMAMAFFAGMSGNIQSSPIITPVPTIMTTSQIVVTTTPISVVQTPKITPLVTEIKNQMIRIPVLPATSLSNEPSVAVKAQYSTITYARDFANKLASQNKMTGEPIQKTLPLIETLVSTSRHDSILELTNRDTVSHVYYIEVNFYEEHMQLNSSNGFSFFVPSGKSVLAEIIPPERATSYVIKNVDIVTTSGYYHTDYNLVQK